MQIQRKYLTIPQFALARNVHRNYIYSLVNDGSIVPDTDIVDGKRLIEWEKYKDLVIGDNLTTRKRRSLNNARKELKEELKSEIKGELKREILDELKTSRKK
jgi:hypothetical protein